MESNGIVDAGSSESGCQDWLPWSRWTVPAWFAYVAFALLFSAAAAFLVKIFAPMAAGSGISEIKCLLSGFNLDGYLNSNVLGVKSFTLPLAIASGLSVGKEGPSVHMACCIGHVIASWFRRFSRSSGQSSWPILVFFFHGSKLGNAQVACVKLSRLVQQQA